MQQNGTQRPGGYRARFVATYRRLVDRWAATRLESAKHARDRGPDFDSEITLRRKLIKTLGQGGWLGVRDGIRNWLVTAA
jgi:hypothetical protein